MTSLLTLTHPEINGGDPVRIMCTSITVQGNKKNSSKPLVNAMKQSEVHTQSIDNLGYNLSNVHYVSGAGFLTWADVKKLYLMKYDGTNAATLKVVYGDDTVFTGLTDEEDIKVVLENFSFPINVNDSKHGYMPVGNLTFKGTA